jgi:hypothetical protein
MKVSRKVQLSYNMGHTRLKNLSETGAKLLILVPGAGLEPARTLPSPRDFKSRVSTNSTIRALSRSYENKIEIETISLNRGDYRSLPERNGV